MGRDKASLLLPHGGTLLEASVAVARQVCDPVLVVGRECPPDWKGDASLFLPDVVSGTGPLGGLQTVLERMTTSVLLPCDLPHLTAAALSWLIDSFDHAAATQPDLAGLAVVQEERIEPLFAVYTRACLPFVEAGIARQRYSLQGVIQAIRAVRPFVLLPAPDFVTAALYNANTPQEWNQAVSSFAVTHDGNRSETKV